MKTRRRKRVRPVASCACGERLEAASLDALNAKLGRHYRTCDVHTTKRR